MAEIVFLGRFGVSYFTYCVVTVLQEVIDSGLAETGRRNGNRNGRGGEKPTLK
jgi:hypothetical protein